MSISSINNEHTTWGVSSYSSNAAAFGTMGGDSGFEETFKNSIGFGTKDEDEGLTGSIAMTEKTESMLGRLQLAFLQNNSTGGVDSRMGNTLF